MRKLGAYFVSAALCWGAGSGVYAEEGLLKDKRSFSTNRPQTDHYDNSVHLQETLEFLGADCVEIKIVGSSQKDDVLIIYDANHRVINNFSGKVNVSFSLPDNKIEVEFRSNSYATDKGFQVNLLEKNIDRCLPEIRQEFINTAQDVLHYGANEITDNLDTAQSHLSNLNASLRQNGSLNGVLPEVMNSFLELANFYQKMGDKAPKIKATLNSRQQALEKIQQQVADIIERLGKGQAEYNSIAERDQLLESRTELQELKKKRLISADAYQKLAANVAVRKKVWERLHQLQYEVLKPLPLYVENIQVLLHFMASNVQVYQQAASETVLRTERLAGFNTDLGGLKQALLIITQQEELLRNALENLGQKYEVTDKPR
ncbi:MAG: hypothetical protein PHP00_11170 [Thiotrichaceae bacterium]|nr:hypothetical protein [Thiotrichaceae bacterium]